MGRMMIFSKNRQTPLYLSEDEIAAVNRLASMVEDRAVERAGASAMPTQVHAPTQLTLLARRLKGMRNRRHRLFDASLFAEPAWDMLLALYVSDGEGYRMSVGELCEQSVVPNTTALRWISILEQQGLIERQPHRLDRRIFHISLTVEGRSLMREFLTDIQELFNGIIDLD